MNIEQQQNQSIALKLVRYSGWLAVLVWSLICFAVLLLEYRSSREHIYGQARIMALTSIEKDIAYQHWVAKVGGIYAPLSEQNPANPYLKNSEREIRTPSGQKLTFVNPAYMTRQVFEQNFSQRTSISGHLTSLKPLRPENSADPWEAEALKAFEKGATEYGEPWDHDGQPAYRLMQPFLVEKVCLDCHGEQGYREGEIRGGLSVIVPIDELQHSEYQRSLLVGVMVGCVWLIGLVGIGFSWRKITLGTKTLQAERDNMQLLFEAAPNGMLLFNRDCEIVMDNAAFREKYCRIETPCGNRIGEALHCKNALQDPRGCGFSEACHSCPIRESLLAALEKNISTDDKECRVTTSGTEPVPLVFLFSVTPLQYIGEQCVLLSLADISEQKIAAQEREKMQFQLQQNQKIESVGRLAGGVAHDFNNMLSTILGNVEMALHKLEPGNSALNYLHQIKDAAKRSADLTRQLLGFARQQPIEPRILELNSAIGDLLNILRRLIGEDIELHWKPVDRETKLLIDPSQLSQILTNLIVNARDAIETTGTLVLSTDHAAFDEDYCRSHPWAQVGDYVELSVSDDGSGMSAEIVEHIFEPFYTTKDVDKGTGLGLATVYGIVKQNNGFLNVYTEPEHGTTFRIYFPSVMDDSPVEALSSEAAQTRGDETVLLVEDEEMLLEIGQRMLNEAGYRVLASLDPLEALELAKNYPETIDLLLTDVIMPKLNGKELAVQLLKTRPEIKVVYMSGYTADIITTRGLLDEGIDLLQKPFSSETLTSKLREVLDNDN